MLLTSRQACQQANLTHYELRKLRRLYGDRLMAIKHNGHWLYPMDMLYATLDWLKSPRRPVDELRTQILRKYGLEATNAQPQSDPTQPRPAAVPR